jgi:hypothetical protein
MILTPEPLREKVRANHSARCEEKLEDFRRQQSAYDQREKESGYTDALHMARSAFATVMELEKAIVAFVPSSLGEAVQKAAWCAWAYREERSYLKDADGGDGLLAAMDAIARASA